MGLKLKLAKYLSILGVSATGLVALSVFSPAAASLLMMVPQLFMTYVFPVIAKITGNLASQLLHYFFAGVSALYHLPLMTKVALGVFGGIIGLNVIVMNTPRAHPEPVDLAKAYLEGDGDKVKHLTGMDLSPLQMPLHNQVLRRKDKKKGAQSAPSYETNKTPTSATPKSHQRKRLFY